MTHRRHLIHGQDVIQLLCSCGWADAPWSTAGLDADHLEMIDLWLHDAEQLHLAESLTP